MATPHYKIKPKDLKAPDEFVTLVDRIGNYLANNLARVILGSVADGLLRHLSCLIVMVPALAVNRARPCTKSRRDIFPFS